MLQPSPSYLCLHTFALFKHCLRNLGLGLSCGHGPSAPKGLSAWPPRHVGTLLLLPWCSQFVTPRPAPPRPARPHSAQPHPALLCPLFCPAVDECVELQAVVDRLRTCLPGLSLHLCSSTGMVIPGLPAKDCLEVWG